MQSYTNASIGFDSGIGRDFTARMEVMRSELHKLAYNFPELKKYSTPNLLESTSTLMPNADLWPSSCPADGIPVKFDSGMTVDRLRPRTRRRQLIRKWQQTRTVPDPNCYLIGGILYGHPDTCRKLATAMNLAKERSEIITKRHGQELPNPFYGGGVDYALKMETKS